jgi:hypothetical protein
MTPMNHHPDEVSQARVWCVQGQLFPQSPRAVCDELRLNWWAAEQLHADGWLSFAPAAVAQLDEAQEAELRFVGALVVAGCDARMLERLLTPLTKPYCYRLSQMSYDWSAQAWRLLPAVEEPKRVFAEWLDRLEQAGDVGRLEEIQSQVERALRAVGPEETGT